MSSTSSPASVAVVDLVIVGGGPAGHSAARAYRKEGGEGRVLIISADDAAPYNRPPLSKDLLRGESSEADLPLEPAGFYPDNGIELWLADAVGALSVSTSTLRTRSGRTVGFRRCVLATGCTPAVLPVSGADHPDVLRLRSLADSRVLRDVAARAGNAVVIGSGFIGCEAAVSLAKRGLDVTMLSTEQLPQLERLGRAAAERIAGWLADAGVKLRAGVTVEAIDDGRLVRTDDGAFEADLVLSAAGVTPNSELAGASGIELRDGRILVDERMRSSVPGFFAAGDVVLAHNASAGRRLKVEHWGEALRMGEIAGANAAGGNESWDEVPGFWSGIGGRTLKYTAWGDGFDRDVLVERQGSGFAVWYSQAGRTVGVLTHDADDDYERGSELIAGGMPPPV
ncbi:MAG: NAD(P)/FAD-dependent oxidoreductase [Nakamurella sp.]